MAETNDQRMPKCQNCGGTANGGTHPFHWQCVRYLKHRSDALEGVVRVLAAALKEAITDAASAGMPPGITQIDDALREAGLEKSPSSEDLEADA